MIDAAKIIADARPGFRPRVAVILGSGMAPMAEKVQEPAIFSYSDLPGFPEIGVAGHRGNLVTGKIGSVSVALLAGRAHYYEKGEASAMAIPLRALADLGTEILIATNAAGSLDPKMGASSVMMITDHINLVQASPLVGLSGNERFVDMSGAYDPSLSEQARMVAKKNRIDLCEGTYVWFCGPQFETPAEVRMGRFLGGTAAGMSTVPEIILARYLGMRALGFSIVTNLGAGLGQEILSHEGTMKNAQAAAERLTSLLVTFIEGLST